MKTLLLAKMKLACVAVVALAAVSCGATGEARTVREDGGAEATPKPSVAWGRAVKGLRMGLSVEGRRFAPGAPIPVSVHVQNLGQEDAVLVKGSVWDSWRFTFSRGGHHSLFTASFCADAGGKRLERLTVAKGATVTLKVSVGSPTGGRWTWQGRHDAGAFEVKGYPLRPGRYKLIAHYSTLPGYDPKRVADAWDGRLRASVRGIEIVTPGATAKPLASPKPAASPKPGAGKKPAAVPADLPHLSKLQQAEIIFVARLKRARPGPVAESMPPIYSHSLELLPSRILRGGLKTGAAVTGQHSARQRKAPVFPVGRDCLVAAAKDTRSGRLRVSLIVQATKEVLASAEFATSLPLGWSITDGKLLSTRAELGGNAWPISS